MLITSVYRFGRMEVEWCAEADSTSSMSYWALNNCLVTAVGILQVGVTCATNLWVLKFPLITAAIHVVLIVILHHSCY